MKEPLDSVKHSLTKIELDRRLRRQAQIRFDDLLHRHYLILPKPKLGQYLPLLHRHHILHLGLRPKSYDLSEADLDR